MDLGEPLSPLFRNPVMPHRQFVDDDGAVWAVWDVRPLAVGKTLDPRLAAPLRAGSGMVLEMNRVMAEGWLCFESAAEKRRLAPIPAGWDSCSSADLLRLCESASGVRRRGPV
jgi:hypothetical protein